MKKFVKGLYDDKFKRYLIVTLFIIGIILLIYSNYQESLVKELPKGEMDFHFFYHPTCPHCHDQKEFNKFLMELYPELNFIYHDVSNAKEGELLFKFATEKNIPRGEIGVPATFFGNYHFIGYESDSTTGKNIKESLDNFFEGINETINGERAAKKTKVTIPFLGEIDALSYSLPMLAIILGLVDGFNPCAMWVLVYLISLILTINDKKKIWLLVGSFVFASGVLYFLFMAAWLNTFLFIGYFRPLTIFMGMFAIGLGVSNVKEYITTKGTLLCKVGDAESKKKTMRRIDQVIMAPLTLATIAGIILLAFIVNSIEFVCSSAIPAVFTQVLAISDLSTWGYYGYILLYDLFFMLDDFIIFGLAAFAISSTVSDKYAKYCKLIGGLILLGIGLVLAFTPGLLR